MIRTSFWGTIFWEPLLFSLSFVFFFQLFPHRITRVFILSATLGSFINPINFKLGTFIIDHLKMCPKAFRHDDVISGHVTSHYSEAYIYRSTNPIRLKLCMYIVHI